jgi:cell division protein ZapA
MPLVNVMINSRAYTIACDDGEEEHLKELGAYVDGKVRELLESVGQVGDSRLLLMAALLLADECFDASSRLDASARSSGEPGGTQEEAAEKIRATEGFVAEKLEQAALRLEKTVARFARGNA